MSRITRASAVLTLVVAGSIGIASCDLGIGGPSGPGVIQMTLISPFGPEGSAVFELSGGVGLSVVATELGDTFYEHHDGTTRAIVVLDEPGVIQFTVRTADVGTVPSVSVVQVADGADQLRTRLSDYRLEFDQREELSSGNQRREP